MSEETPYTGDSMDSPPPRESFAKSMGTDEAILLTLIALSAIGIGVTNFDAAKSFWYWTIMAPVFGLVSLFIGWSKARRRGEGVSRIVRVQILHWAGLFAAIVLIYILYDPAGKITETQLGILCLLALALTTFLAGVHLDWRFMLVGIVLGACVAGAAVVEQFIWMIIIPIAVAIFLIVFWWKRKI